MVRCLKKVQHVKHVKHILPNGGEFNGDESHGTIRKQSP